MVLGTPDLLIEMLNNSIENAVHHAFSENKQNRIEIFLCKSESYFSHSGDKSFPVASILFSNNGLPFPKEFDFSDFIRKGFSSGENRGNGFGGWYINEVVKFHNGHLDIIDETGPEGLPESDLSTSFEIEFPLLDVNEEI